MNDFQRYLQKWHDGKTTYIPDGCFVIKKYHHLIVQVDSGLPLCIFLVFGVLRFLLSIMCFVSLSFVRSITLAIILLVLASLLCVNSLHSIGLYIFHKDRITHLDFDILKNKTAFLKVNPQIKTLKSFKTSEIKMIYYKSQINFNIRFPIPFYSLNLLFKNNKRFKIYTGIKIEAVKKLGKLISSFLNKPFTHKTRKRITRLY